MVRSVVCSLEISTNTVYYLGDIVRIAPNELVFVTPEALRGKYTKGISVLGYPFA